MVANVFERLDLRFEIGHLFLVAHCDINLFAVLPIRQTCQTGFPSPILVEVLRSVPSCDLVPAPERILRITLSEEVHRYSGIEEYPSRGNTAGILRQCVTLECGSELHHPCGARLHMRTAPNLLLLDTRECESCTHGNTY